MGIERYFMYILTTLDSAGPLVFAGVIVMLMIISIILVSLGVRIFIPVDRPGIDMRIKHTRIDRISIDKLHRQGRIYISIFDKDWEQVNADGIIIDGNVYQPVACRECQYNKSPAWFCAKNGPCFFVIDISTTDMTDAPSVGSKANWAALVRRGV